MGKLLDVLIEAMSRARLRYLGGLGAHCLQCVDHGAVEEPPARREKPAIRNLAHPIVGEVQLVPDRLEHAVPDHLLDRLRRVALFHTAGGAEEGEVEPAADDCGHGGYLLSRRTEPVQPAGDETTHAGRQGYRAGLPANARPQAVLIEGAHAFHGNERIALAHGPDPLFHLRHRRGVAPGTSKGTHEQRRVGA